VTLQSVGFQLRRF